MPKKPKSGKSKTTKKTRKMKDKNAPKRAMGAFFCYQKVRREQLTKEQSNLENKQIVSVSLNYNN